MLTDASPGCSEEGASVLRPICPIGLITRKIDLNSCGCPRKGATLEQPPNEQTLKKTQLLPALLGLQGIRSGGSHFRRDPKGLRAGCLGLEFASRPPLLKRNPDFPSSRGCKSWRSIWECR